MKIDKNKMVGMTGVKRQTFDRLVKQMEVFADQIIGKWHVHENGKSLSTFLLCALHWSFCFQDAKKAESQHANDASDSRAFLESLENLPGEFWCYSLQHMLHSIHITINYIFHFQRTTVTITRSLPCQVLKVRWNQMRVILIGSDGSSLVHMQL